MKVASGKCYLYECLSVLSCLGLDWLGLARLGLACLVLSCLAQCDFSYQGGTCGCADREEAEGGRGLYVLCRVVVVDLYIESCLANHNVRVLISKCDRWKMQAV